MFRSQPTEEFLRNELFNIALLIHCWQYEKCVTLSKETSFSVRILKRAHAGTETIRTQRQSRITAIFHSIRKQVKYTLFSIS